MARKPLVFSLVLMGGNFLSVSQGQEATIERPRVEGSQRAEVPELRWTTPSAAVRQAAHESPVMVAQADGSARTATLADRFSTVRRSNKSAPVIENTTPVGTGAGEPTSTISDEVPSVLKRKVKPPVEKSSAERGSSSATSETNTETAAETPKPFTPSGTPTRKSSTRVPGSAARSGGDSGSASSSGTDKTVSLRSPGPMLLVEATGPKAVIIGKPAAYAVTVVNSSQIAAANVQVHVQIPPGIETSSLRSAVGEVSRTDEGEQAGTVTWSIPEVAGGARVELALQVIPRDSSGFELGVNWTCQPRSAVASIAVQQPQLELTISGPKDARFGETVTLVVTVSNPGTGDAEDVNVKLQAGQNSPENIPIGLVPAGQQKQIEVQLAANQAGTSQVVVEATGDGDLKANASAELVVRRAELQVAVSAPSRTFTGTPTGFQVKVSNSGNAASEDTTLTVTLPAGAKLEASTEGSRPSGNGVTWRVGALPPGVERVFEVQCELTASGENKLDARVTAATGLNATGSATTEVQALADLKLAVDDPKGPRNVGEDVTYEITVANRGTKAAEDVHVVVQFSDGLEPIGADGGAAELADGQVVFEPLSRLASGQKSVLKVKARADKAGSHRFRVQVTCDDSETQLVSEGTSRFFGDGSMASRGSEPTPARVGARPIPTATPSRR